MPSASSEVPLAVSGPCTIADGMCVRSGNFPGNYGNDEKCTIRNVPRVPIRVVAFDTEHARDKMTIDRV